jgi:hypothetical protein
MSEERYIDPNSGAAPQPGGAFAQAEKPEEIQVPVPHLDQALTQEVPAQKETPEQEETPVEEKAPEETPEETPAEEAPEEEAPQQEEGFDPAAHSINEVLAYVEENPDQKDAVLEQERDGKNRSTLIAKLEES